MTWQEMLAEAKKLIVEAEATQAKAHEEGREITEEEQIKIDDLCAKATVLQQRAETKRKLESLSASLSEPLERLTKPNQIPDDNQPQSLPAVPAQAIDRKKEGMHGWGFFGEFAAAVYGAGANDSGPPDGRLFHAAASGAQQKIGSQGGFLVPPTFSNVIWDGLRQGSGNLLNMTDNYTVEGESLTFPAVHESSRADGSRWGGVQGYWVDEAAQITSSKPKFRQIKLEPHEAAVLIYATNKLINNSPVALEQWLTRAATDELNFMFGSGIVEGDGAGKPLGIKNSGALIAVAKETGQTAATIMSENIVKMFARLHPVSRSRAAWLINVDCEPQLNLMTVGVGASGLPSYMPPGGLSASPYATLMGRPVIPTEFCETVGTQGDVYLADLQAYAVGMRGGVDSSMSIHLRFDYHETCFKFVVSLDGQPWLNSAITPYKGTNTLSPFVALAVRS
jgi:HK97 family phage major capsid protein